MRVMIATFPSTSHLYPVIPLAWALQSAGHEVCVVGHPGMGSDDMAATVTGAGLIAVPVGDTVVAQQQDRTEEEGSRLDIPPDAFALDVVGSGRGTRSSYRPASWRSSASVTRSGTPTRAWSPS
ncbi:hypothetical protein [Streptomyces johnsoniae]|uniref:Glycosyltransferase n=1 Tax=Streptomyces johnsoniae TaxID=3075532 RepID=A0ABU2S701_9ACTN|nr:hypothetical protein [Streptomyces sp. DSM 41886]MDT0444588.1 hypothetical protein [Streptomyces sp. DSM 41886]